MRKGITVISIALLVMLLLSACGTDPATQQKQASRSKAILDKAIAHAQNIGVPDTMLKPIEKQTLQLSQTNAPLTLFYTSPATDYYAHLAQRYQMLTVQVQGLEFQATEQLDFQANSDLQSFARILAQRQAQGFAATKTFATQLAQQQNLLAKAQYPKNYLQISAAARKSTQALRLMGPTYDTLTTLRSVIKQLDSSHIDITALQQQEQYDLEQFRKASTPTDFSTLTDQINTQLQTTTALSTQAIPYVGAARLNQFTSDIADMRQFGLDVTTYQQQLDNDKAALHTALSINDFLKVSAQIDSHMSAIQLPLLQAQAQYQLHQFHQEVKRWGDAHRYHDPLDGISYDLDYSYDQQGIGEDLDAALQAATTQDDYQAVNDLITNSMLHLKAMEADYTDNTPYNRPHATDIQLMQNYHLNSGQVIVVSLIEQTLRLYQDGKLVKAFLITSGQFEKPSPPGFWHIFLRESPTKFKSSEPQGSAFWYPDTNINYAMGYHDGGYFIHDSWWRADYGPNTNFPHNDSGGNQSFAGNGSHGCINMQEQQAAWLYNATSYNTAMLVY